MPSIQFALLAAFVLAGQSSITNAVTSTSSTLACSRVVLSSQSSTKWLVNCITEGAATVSSASFNPSLVQNFYVNSGAYVAPSSSNLNLSSTFSEVDVLVSSSITKFSLSAASGYKPTIPVTIVSTAFAELSALQTLHLEAIPLANSKLHLILPSSIQQISIIDCGLSNVSFEFADGSAIADSALSIIDLRLNALNEVPTSLYALPSTVSTIDLRGNDQLNFSTETSAHTKQLSTWIDDDVLQADNAAITTLDSSTGSQEERSSVAGFTKSEADNLLPTSSSSSGSDESVTTTQYDSDKGTIPVTIVAIVVPVVLAFAFMLAFVVRKRRRMQERETDAILDLPHPFGKMPRDRSETSGNFTSADSELSRSRMSSGDSHYYDAHDRDSCVILDVTPTDTGDDSTQQTETSTSANMGYVNLNSPQDAHQNFSLTHTISNRKDGNSDHSLELLGTLSTASTTPAQARLAARKTLRSALKSLVETTPNADSASTSALLTVNAYEYSFSPGTMVEETSLAFFIDCRLTSCVEVATSVPAPPSKLALKIFIEDDADLVGRESYALSCLQQDDSTRAFAPRVHDTALEYELVVGNLKANPDAVKLNCCILVLEMPSCTTLSAHLAASRELLPQQLSRVVNAVRALHTRGLVHGAFHTDSLVACSPDGRLKFWGLEHASKAGHKIPCPDADLLKVFQAEYVAPELALLALEDAPSSRTSPSLDIWSLGVTILKMYASGRQLEEFKGCATPRDVFERLNASDSDGEPSNTCFFERSIAQFVQNEGMRDILRQCLQRTWTSRPSVDSISKHNFFQTMEREVSRPIPVKNAAVSRMLSAIIEEKDLNTLQGSIDMRPSGEPERETSGKDQLPEELEDKVSELINTSDDVTPELLPPSLCLFLAPVELEIDLTQRGSFYSVEQWVSELKHLQQQQAEELRFPLVFMCESCDSNAAVPCSISTTTKCGASVSASLLPLVMPLVRETMLFLEARAIVSNRSSVGEASGFAEPQQWQELRTFYRALERMELATVNPVNEVELAPMEQQLKSRDPTKAQEVLDKLTCLVFSEEKREYVRNLLDALVSDEDLVSRAERSSWAALRRCDVTCETSSTLSRTRWLCSHHVPHES